MRAAAMLLLFHTPNVPGMSQLICFFPPCLWRHKTVNNGVVGACRERWGKFL